MYDSVIFDEDGVLIQSNIDNFRWMDRARIQAASELGYEFTKEDSKRVVEAESVEEIEEFLDEKQLSWVDLEMIEEKVQLKKVELIKSQEITLYSGVRNVLRKVENSAVASNAPMETTQFALKFFRIQQDFEVVKAPLIKNLEEYFARKKPSPIMINEIIRETSWENPIMVGDTGTDIEAAKRAGIDVARVETNSMRTEKEPDYYLNNLEELLDLVNFE